MIGIRAENASGKIRLGVDGGDYVFTAGFFRGSGDVARLGLDRGGLLIHLSGRDDLGVLYDNHTRKLVFRGQNMVMMLE